MGVSEIGRKCLFTSRTGFCFSTGTTYACFHDNGKRPSWDEEFKMLDTVSAKMSACSFNNHPGMLSEPLALIVSCGLTQPTQQGSFRSSY